MKIVAVRHGETEGNIRHIVESHTGGALTEKGREQAKNTGQQLVSEQFDVVYVSDLSRCIETVENMLPGVPYVCTKLLRERSNGVYDGRSWSDLPPTVFNGSDITTRIEGGESWLDIDARIASFINDIYEQYPSGKILLVTHAGPIKVLRSLVDGVALQEAVIGLPPNAGIWRGEVTGPLQHTVVS
jgi:alpha-ribazole phosphatase